MFESLSSPNIHTPQNLAEYANTITHYPQSSLWAFGSSIMDSADFYPNKNANVEIIYIGQIDELYKFQRNDRAVEFGAMVNLNEILSSGKSILPPILLETLKNIACYSVRNRISLGGAMANKRFVSSILGTLVILDSQVEIRYLKKKRLHYHFFPISKLTEEGQLTLQPTSMISRVRIVINNYNYQYYRIIDNPMLEKETCVSVAFIGNIEQITINSARVAITYPDKGFLVGRELDACFNNLQLPLEPQLIIETVNKVMLQVNSTFQPSPIQQERTKKLLLDMINNMNYTVLNANHE